MFLTINSVSIVIITKLFTFRKDKKILNSFTLYSYKSTYKEDIQILLKYVKPYNSFLYSSNIFYKWHISQKPLSIVLDDLKKTFMEAFL